MRVLRAQNAGVQQPQVPARIKRPFQHGISIHNKLILQIPQKIINCTGGSLEATAAVFMVRLPTSIFLPKREEGAALESFKAEWRG
jgi:hypothetical protein